MTKWTDPNPTIHKSLHDDEVSEAPLCSTSGDGVDTMCTDRRST